MCYFTTGHYFPARRKQGIGDGGGMAPMADAHEGYAGLLQITFVTKSKISIILTIRQRHVRFECNYECKLACFAR